ncbi:MAG TPA: cupin domain-containing protein [Bacillota bacterium]
MPGIRRFERDRFRWDGVPERVYKFQDADASERGLGWKDVVRNTLFGKEGEPARFEVRYFEIAPGGYSTLERHQHVHAVTVLRGEGDVVVGGEVHRVRPFDFVYIPPMELHQFVNAGDEPFGFLCVVDVDRDRPRPPSADELAALQRHPVVGPVIRR